jgi:hypothetical protein
MRFASSAPAPNLPPDPLKDEPSRSSFSLVVIAGLVVVGAILMLPAILLIGVAYYLVAALQALGSLLRAMTGRKTPAPAEPLPRPHLWVWREESAVAPKSSEPEA